MVKIWDRSKFRVTSSNKFSLVSILNPFSRLFEKRAVRSDCYFLCIAQNKTSFHFQYVIGRGGFGKVWKVELRKQKKLYAMKEMAKARVISKRSVNSVMNEKKFLSQLNHPFLVNMHYAFQDRDNLYLVIDFM